MHCVYARLNALTPRALRIAGPVGMHEEQMEGTLNAFGAEGDLLRSSEFARRSSRKTLHRAQLNGKSGVQQQVLDRPSQQLIKKAMIAGSLGIQREPKPAPRHSPPTVAR